MRGWKNIFHINGNQKKAGIAILISEKIDFKILLQETKDTTQRPRNQSKKKVYNCKYICTKHRNTSIYKANPNSH